MFCTGCGTNLPDDSIFCPVCGQATNSDTQVLPTPQAAAPEDSAPQYAAPQYAAPQYTAPQYSAPQYGNPQYDTPQYDPAPQYGVPNQNGAKKGNPVTDFFSGLITGVKNKDKKSQIITFAGGGGILLTLIIIIFIIALPTRSGYDSAKDAAEAYVEACVESFSAKKVLKTGYKKLKEYDIEEEGYGKESEYRKDIQEDLDEFKADIKDEYGSAKLKYKKTESIKVDKDHIEDSNDKLKADGYKGKTIKSAYLYEYKITCKDDTVCYIDVIVVEIGDRWYVWNSRANLPHYRD